MSAPGSQRPSPAAPNFAWLPDPSSLHIAWTTVPAESLREPLHSGFFYIPDTHRNWWGGLSRFLLKPKLPTVITPVYTYSALRGYLSRLKSNSAKELLWREPLRSTLHLAYKQEWDVIAFKSLRKELFMVLSFHEIFRVNTKSTNVFWNLPFTRESLLTQLLELVCFLLLGFVSCNMSNTQPLPGKCSMGSLWATGLGCPAELPTPSQLTPISLWAGLTVHSLGSLNCQIPWSVSSSHLS